MDVLLDKINELSLSLFKWQTLVGSFFGAITPFLLWWFTEKYQQRKKHDENLYFLEKVLVEQINDILEIKRTLIVFKENKLGDLVSNIKANKPGVFSIDGAYFPFFSVTPLGERLYDINTKSSYIENKLAKTLQISRNMPHIIKDIKRQFEDTIEMNKNLSLNKINPPDVQRQNYLDNIKNYKEMLERDMLNINIPVYLKLLIETRTALNEMRKIGRIKWAKKFDPSYSFFWCKSEYIRAKEDVFDNIENYFEEEVGKEYKRLLLDEG